jgi:hypothetical protein
MAVINYSVGLLTLERSRLLAIMAFLLAHQSNCSVSRAFRRGQLDFEQMLWPVTFKFGPHVHF